MDKTCSAIVDASKVPLSIIIVGVGKDQFSNMHHLDGDENRLSCVKDGGRVVYAERDIVQVTVASTFDRSTNDLRVVLGSYAIVCSFPRL